MRTPVPITIVTGFLGAGKTTFVNHLLAAAPTRRIGVLVNDFGEIDIDSRLIVGSANGVTSLTNGCICCSMKGDLIGAMMRVLEHENPPEHILVEASGLSNPGSLADIFLELQKQRVLRVDGIVALVDAEHFPFADLKGQALARDQVLASDMVVLNKVDLVDDARLLAIEDAIRARIPEARIVRSDHGRVPVEVALGLHAGAGSESAARAHAHGQAPTHAHDRDPVDGDRNGHGDASSSSSTDHDFSSFSFHRDAAVSFKRLVEMIRALPAGVVRIKGIISVHERPGDTLALHVVGKRVAIETIAQDRSPPSTDLVIIGNASAIRPTELEAGLAACFEDTAGSYGAQ